MNIDSSIDKNHKGFIIICGNILNKNYVEECFDVFKDALKEIGNNDYNLIVAVYTVVVNRTIALSVEDISGDVNNDAISAEDFAEIVNKIIEELKTQCNTFLELLHFEKTLADYLRKLNTALFSAFTFSKLVLKGYSIDMWEREECIYDKMHLLAKESFTKKHSIEIPYLYIFAWAIHSYVLNKKNGIGLKYASENSEVCIKMLGNSLVDILFDRNLDDGCYDDELIECSYTGLLPTFEYVSNKPRQKNKKQLLLSIPMLPVIETMFTRELYKWAVELIRSNIDLKAVVAERNQAITDKNSVITDFTHTYGNMKATSLYNVAQTLLKSNDIGTKRMGRQVLLEYGIKQDLTKAIYMMRLKFDKNTIELRRLICDSISTFTENSVSIVDVIDSAMLLSLLRVFYDASDKKAVLARNQLKKIVPSLNSLRDSFEEEVIFATKSVTNWTGEYIAPIKLEMSENWKKLYLLKESYGAIFVVDIFAECFYNVLKYGDLSDTIGICLNELYGQMSIEITNSIAKSDKTYSGIGLSSKQEMLAIINGNCSKSNYNNAMSWRIDENKFNVKINLNSNIFIMQM